MVSHQHSHYDLRPLCSFIKRAGFQHAVLVVPKQAGVQFLGDAVSASRATYDNLHGTSGILQIDTLVELRNAEFAVDATFRQTPITSK